MKEYHLDNILTNEHYQKMQKHHALNKLLLFY